MQALAVLFVKVFLILAAMAIKNFVLWYTGKSRKRRLVFGKPVCVKAKLLRKRFLCIHVEKPFL